jgi:hypothetical protein
VPSRWGVRNWRYYPRGRDSAAGDARAQHAHGLNGMRQVDETAEQRDAADEGRLDAYGSIIMGKVIVNGARSVRPSQLITSVRLT